MKIIALEEHFWTPAIRAAFQRIEPSQRDERLDRFNREPMASKLENLGTSRLQEMDAVGIDVAVLSLTTPATQIFPPSEAVPLARDANDYLAAVIKAHPDRFAGFATLPTPNPEAAAQELERAIHTLGFKGAMIHGRTGEWLLDHPTFRPLLETAADLDVPLYIHPQMPSGVVQSAYYTGFEPAVNTALASGGWGWHMETAINVLRLILAGVFDRSPTLQVILGHWGEMIPFYLERVDTLS